MCFELSSDIHRSPAEVFAFLRGKDKHPQEPGSPVLALEQTSPGPVGVGTRYREAVRMLPGVHGETVSVITRFELGEYLEEDFEGAGMIGHLAYQFVWCLPSQLDRNPFVWMLEVNGVVVDVRHMPRAVQQIAYQKGWIPYIPADHQAKESPAVGWRIRSA